MLAPTCLPLTCPEAGGQRGAAFHGGESRLQAQSQDWVLCCFIWWEGLGCGGGEVNPLWGNVEISAVQSLSS